MPQADNELKARPGTFERVVRLESNPLGTSRTRWFIHSGLSSVEGSDRAFWPRIAILTLREGGGQYLSWSFTIDKNENISSLEARRWRAGDRDTEILEPPSYTDMLKQIDLVEKKHRDNERRRQRRLLASQ